MVYWNRGAEAVFGYASAEAIDCSLNEMIVPFDRLEEEGKSFRETLETGAAIFESIRRRKDLALICVLPAVSLGAACDSSRCHPR
jgi:PAS domain S-box-containing protein